MSTCAETARVSINYHTCILFEFTHIWTPYLFCWSSMYHCIYYT